MREGWIIHFVLMTGEWRAKWARCRLETGPVVVWANGACDEWGALGSYTDLALPASFGGLLAACKAAQLALWAQGGAGKCISGHYETCTGVYEAIERASYAGEFLSVYLLLT